MQILLADRTMNVVPQAIASCIAPIGSTFLEQPMPTDVPF